MWAPPRRPTRRGDDARHARAARQRDAHRASARSRPRATRRATSRPPPASSPRSTWRARRRRTCRPTAAPRSLLKDVNAEPLAQSNLVVVTAKGPSAVSAQNLANTFADAGGRGPHREVQRAGRQAHQGARAARAEPSARLPGQAADPLRQQLSELRTLRAGGDPTMRVDTRADKPTSPSWPKRKLSIIAGHHGRPRAGRRRRLRRPDARPAPAPRGAAARALPAAGPGPHPGGEPRPRPRGRRPAPALARRRGGLPNAARDAQRTAPDARRAAPAR